jgi:hypothetical protein
MTTTKTPPEHTAASQSVQKKKKREKRKNWLRNLFNHTTLRNKTHSFRSRLTPHLPGADSSKSFSRTHLLWQTIRKRVRVCCDRRERKRSLLKPRAPSRSRTCPPRVRLYCDRQQGRGQKSGLQWINPTGPSEWLYKETPKKDKEDLAKSSY